MNVLLVDDHASIRHGLRELLEMADDIRVVGEGVNGKEAVEKVDSLGPDIVLMDMNMPVMNGVEATKLIKERHPEVHVVGLTAFGDMSLVTAMVRAGAAGYLLKGGTPQELIDSLEAVAKGKGALDRAVARQVMDDMAELYKKEADALAELDRMKSEFVSVVSHELRTPLTSIKGGVHTLQRGWSEIPDDTKLDFLGSITKQCDRLQSMVEKILTVSGIQRGGLGLRPRTFQLDRVAAEAVELLASKAQGRTLVLSMADVPAQGDPDRVREVAVALIENALHFTSGKVSVRVEAGPRPRILVEDEGPGISPETLTTLLERPFVQADSSSTRRVGGLGLSLYIARQVLSACGGTLEIDTGPDRGSIFAMVLPSPEA